MPDLSTPLWCKTCFGPLKTGQSRCNMCWEVESRLSEYLRSSVAQVKVLRLIAQINEGFLGDTRER